MIIGIDGNEANVPEKVGISEYSFELLHQFKEFHLPTGGSNFQFRIYLKNDPRSDMPQESENWKYRIVKPAKLWTQIGLPLNLYSHKPRPDVFFTPTHYAPRFCPIPTAISIMDLSYIHFPQLFRKRDLYKLRNWTAYSARKAKAIFTISQASKNDILNEYSIDEKKIHVTYPGIKPDNTMGDTISIDSLQKKYSLRKEYILFVGTLQPRKNIVRLIEAFAKTKKDSKKEIELLIVGKKGWLFEEILSAPERFGVENDVKFLEFISDEELTTLYKHAICFVLPSLYEGFGLPILEAMKNGCPVITSNVSSLPEAGGEAALYIDPQDVSDIAKKIHLVLTDKKNRDDMIKKGYGQIKKFSWERTAKETLSVLKTIVE